MKPSCLVAIVLLLGGPVQSAAAGTLHVPADFATIQSAIVSAQDFDTIMVSPGVYHEAIDFLGKDIRVIGADGPEATTIDGTGLGTSVVKLMHAEPATALLQGFTITGGTGMKFWPGTDEEGKGGGIYIDANAHPLVRNCIIRDNHVSGEDSYGGGVTVVPSTAGPTRLVDCVIKDNSATGIYSSGGGVTCPAPVGSTYLVELVNCQVIHNVTDGSGGGVVNPGRVEGCLIAANSANLAGGLWLWPPNDSAPFPCAHTVVRDNTALQGGAGVLVSNNHNSPIVLEGLVVQNNHTWKGFGGIGISTGTPPLTPNVLRDCLIADNTSGDGYGGVGAGGIPSVLVDFDHCTIVGNGFYLSNGDFRNCIVRELSAPLAGPSITVAWSDIEGGFPGIGNLDADPLFVDRAAGDFHLLAASPCHDAGDPAFTAAPGEQDVDGDARVLEGHTDMGGDEYSDCNGNGLPDSLDIQQGTLTDCDLNGQPDECNPPDCNGNGQPDACDIAQGLAADCNENGVPDECEWVDCDADGMFDPCEIAAHLAPDCNGNGVPDACDILSGFSFDDDLSGVPDTCEGVLHVPADAPDVQQAVALVGPGGGIVISAGVWSGPGFIDDFTIPTAGFLIEGAGGSSACVLDASVSGHGWTLAPAAAGQSLTVRGITFRGATAGLILLMTNAQATFEDCVFEDNHFPTGASSSGGAIDTALSAQVAFVRCSFRGNGAALGGAVRVRGPATFDHCTFADNEAWTAGASLRAQSSFLITMSNSIAWGGTAPAGQEISAVNGATVVIDHCDVAGGQAGIHVAAGAVLNWGAGNVDADPQFVDAVAGNLQLQDGSPCINAGDPAGTPDPDGSPSEMGAWPWSAWTNLGGAVGGESGVPVLAGTGSLLPDTNVLLDLGIGPPGTPVALFVGLSALGVPFKGGVFWPHPDLVLVVPLGADGQLQLQGNWPAGLPSALSTYIQAWFADDTAAHAVAGSNALRAVTPP